jgi:thioredoxin-related protein
MKKILLLCCINLFLATGPALAEPAPGRVTGGRAHDMPGWFKSSFLNFKEDVDEARQAGKHVLIFFDLNDCPYCTRVLDENFRQGENMEFTRKHFDVIAINLRGAQEVTWLDGSTMTEQALAQKLKVFGTPYLAFLSPEGNQVLQLNGYRTPTDVRHALEFVQTRAYRQQTLAAYIEKKQAPVYTLRDHPRFEKLTDLSAIRKPLAVIFEDRRCTDCVGFHEKVLNHPDVLAEMKSLRVVRLDAQAETPFTDIAGTRTTPKAWATALKLNSRPAVIMFDEGREIQRMDGRLYHFHFKELLRYVSGQHYKQHPRFGAYLDVRQPEILKQGTNIDFGE